jgi:hypothetical protein
MDFLNSKESMNLILDLAKGYCLLYGTTWIHEIGHYVMGTLLIETPLSCHVNWKNLRGATIFVSDGHFTKWMLARRDPDFRFTSHYLKWMPARKIAVDLAGPIAGTLGFLILSNQIEITSIFLKTVIVSLEFNRLLRNFVPEYIEGDVTDGANILRTLGFTVPSSRWSRLMMKTFTMLIGTYVGMRWTGYLRSDYSISPDLYTDPLVKPMMYLLANYFGK